MDLDGFLWGRCSECRRFVNRNHVMRMVSFEGDGHYRARASSAFERLRPPPASAPFTATPPPPLPLRVPGPETTQTHLVGATKSRSVNGGSITDDS